MRLNRECYIEDIIKYENSEGVSILEELSCAEPFICIDMIKMINKCSYDEAESIFTEALNEMSLAEIAETIAKCLIPVQEDDKENTVSTNEHTRLSDVLEQFYEQLQIVDKNLSLTEFKGMSTRYLYKYADGLQKRYIADENMKLKDHYTNVAMLTSALAGKLKECPQLNEDGTLHKQTLREKLLAMKGR